MHKIDRAVAQAANAEGVAAISKNDGPAAVAAFRLATQADPTAVSLWVNLAHGHRLCHDDAAEREALENALAIDRTDFTAQLRMAQLFQRADEEASALLAWDGVNQLSAHFAELPAALTDELAAGNRFCSELRTRISAAADAALDRHAGGLDETEARRVRAFVDRALGRRQIYLNVCAGLHYPFLPADEFFDRRHFPWMDDLESHAATIQAEVRSLQKSPSDVIRPYVRLDPGTPSNQWSPLDGSLEWSACFLWEYGKPHEAALARCPKTAALLERLPLARIPGRAPNVFFSMLQPGGIIPPHTGVTNTRAIIHLALDVPQDCGFRVGGETREWIEGKAFAFDDTIEHEAWNRSDRPRAVLIFDVWNPHLTSREQDAIVSYFAASDQALT